jgi:inhibitor of cysteine peptidase
MNYLMQGKGLCFALSILVLAGTAVTVSANQSSKVAPSVFTAKTTAIAVDVGQTFLIALDANVTTGYSWSTLPGFNAGVIAVEGSSYRSPDGVLPGAGGTQIFIVRGLAAGKTKLLLGYARPFEKGTPPVRKAEFTIVVR